MSELTPRELAKNKLLPNLQEAFVEINRLQKELTESRAECERLRNDAERLDWIEHHASRYKVEIARSLFGNDYEFGLWSEKLRAIPKIRTLREAIDQAIEEAKK